MRKFLQLSDLHLGAKLSSIPEPAASELRDALKAVVRSAFEAAQQHAVDLVLLPGDLYENDGIDPAAQLRFIYQLAAQIAPVPVVIAPGNHDPYSDSSPYATEQPPDNVHLFTSPQFQVFDTGAGLVTGRAYQSGEGYERIDWATLPPPADGGLLVLHGSLLSAGDDRRHSRTVVPLTEEALRDSGYAYTALGHYHNQREFRRGGDFAFAAYSGCPQGQGWDEQGPKGYILGELEPSGARLKFIAADLHRFRSLDLRLPGGWNTDLSTELKTRLGELAGQVGSADALDLRVSGRWPTAGQEQLAGMLQAFTDRAWHSRPPDLSQVEFHPELAAPGHSEVLDEFLELCRQGLAQATGADGEAWELAQYLGHRLLSGQGLAEEVQQ